MNIRVNLKNADGRNWWSKGAEINGTELMTPVDLGCENEKWFLGKNW